MSVGVTSVPGTVVDVADKTVVAADGTNLTHRVWFAQQQSASLESAHRSLLSMLQAAAKAARTERVLVAFDAPGAADRRRVVLPGYKSGRAAKPEGLVEALAMLPELLVADGLPVVQVDGCEADDVLAAAAGEFPQTACFTSDKDAFALVRDPDVAVLRPGNPPEWVTEVKLRERFGVDGPGYLLLSALCGDKSDGIDGLPGVGPKGAAKLVAAVGSLEGFRQDVAEGGALLTEALGKARAARLLADAELTVSLVGRNVGLMTPFAMPPLGRVPRWAALEPDPPF